MRVAFEQVLRAGPEHESVECRVWKIRAELVNEWGGDQRVANARQGNHEDLHRTVQSSPGLALRRAASAKGCRGDWATVIEAFIGGAMQPRAFDRRAARRS